METGVIDPHPVRSAEEHRAQVEGGRMRYLRAGSGPPLVLVHGLLGYSFSWRFVVEPLSRYATVYCVDMLGTGFSDRPAELDATLRGSAKRLLQFLDQLNIARSDLLGSSRGGAF